jgi:DNA replication and repair protein RecF
LTDLLVTHGPKGIAAGEASTGEQKALLVGLVLAHAGLVAAMTEITPILLLDEIAAHLDPARRGALYQRLAGLGAQVWMSGADPAVFDPIASSAAWFDVTPGRAERRS